MNTLQAMSVKALQRGADYPAVEWQGQWINWQQLADVAAQVQALVKSSGADQAAPVALLPRNRPGGIAVLLGLIADARNVSMIHVYQAPAGIARDIDTRKPAIVVGDKSDFTDELIKVLQSSGICGITIDGMELAYAPGCEKSSIKAGNYPEQLQLELLTSGTTGPPKPFALSYEMIAEHMVGNNLMQTSNSVDPLSFPPIFMYLSVNTISGIYLTLPTLLPGVRGVLVEKFSLEGWRTFVREHKPTAAHVPVPAIQMALEADIPAEDFASLKSLGTGTAPLDPSVQKAFEEKYNIPILLAYGATEFGGPVTLMTLDDFNTWGSAKSGSVGRAWAGAKLRVIDADTEQVLPVSSLGILEVMTPRMGDHWIRTSDLGRIDEDGFLFLAGRADGAINRGGFKMMPSEIEQALKLHPAVSAAAVIGLADTRLGQVPGAAIQLRADADAPSIEALEQHLRKHVAATHIPTQWRFVESLPYNAMFKVDQVAMRKLFE